MSVRIAAVVPVGYLDRMGYQHVWPVCRDNLLGALDDHGRLIGDASEHLNHPVAEGVGLAGIVYQHDAGDRAQEGTITDQPGENVV